MRRRSSIALVVALGGFLTASGLSAQAPTLETARAALAKGAYAEASALYTALLQQGSLAGGALATVYLERGIAQQKNGYVSHAVSDYTNALWLDAMSKPTRAQAKINRGVAFLELGQLSRAINDFDSAIEQDGKLAEAYFGRATARRLNGEPDKALSDYAQALALGGGRPDLIHFGQGLAYESMGKRPAAVEAYRKAAALGLGAPRTKLQALGEKLPDPALSAPSAPQKVLAGRVTVADAADAVLAEGATEEATGAVALGATPEAEKPAAIEAVADTTPAADKAAEALAASPAPKAEAPAEAAPPKAVPQFRPSLDGPLSSGGTTAPAPSAAPPKPSSVIAPGEAEAQGAPRPITMAALASTPTDTASLPQPSSSPASGSFSVQIAAYFEQPTAERGLSEFLAKYPQISEATPPILETAVLTDGRTVYRLKLGPYSDAARAGESCQALRALGQNCIVIPPRRTAQH